MASAQGVVSLRMKCGSDQSRKCNLYDVLYVPELSYNLLSISKAVEKGNTVKFTGSSCVVRDANCNNVAVASRIGGLYEISADPVWVNSATTGAQSCCQVTKEDLWHCRYGHLSVKNLQKLA